MSKFPRGSRAAIWDVFGKQCENMVHCKKAGNWRKYITIRRDAKKRIPKIWCDKFAVPGPIEGAEVVEWESASVKVICLS